MSWSQSASHCQLIGKNVIIICIAMCMYERFRETISCLRNYTWWEIGIVFGIVRVLVVICMYIYRHIRCSQDKGKILFEELSQDESFETSTSCNRKTDIHMKEGVVFINSCKIESNDQNKQYVNGKLGSNENCSIMKESPAKITKDDNGSFEPSNYDKQIVLDSECLIKQIENINKLEYSILDKNVKASSDESLKAKSLSDMHEAYLKKVCDQNKNNHEQIIEEMIEQSIVDWIIQEEGHHSLMNDNPLIVTDFDQSSRKSCSSKTKRKKPKIPSSKTNSGKVPLVQKKSLEITEEEGSDVDIQSSMFQKG